MAIDQKVPALISIKVERVAFGVRFQPHYQLLDHVGSVIDRILRSQGSPFGPLTFPLSRREAGEHNLFNPETNNELKLNHSDAILQMKVDTRKTLDIETLGRDFSTYVLDTLRQITHLDDIARYGVLFQLEECRSLLRETPAQHYLQQDFPDARSLSLRFTKRLPVMEALVRKGVNDYRNAIYTVKQTEEGKVTISVDYQEYFNPELNAKEWAEKPYADFVSRGIEYLLDAFQKWLIRLFEKQEAA